MAKSRRRKSSIPAGSRSEEPIETPQMGESLSLPRAARFSLIEYVVVVVFLWLFCGLMFLTVWWITGEKEGMSFFFLSICIAFTAVAFFSWLHDLFYREDPEEKETSP